MIKGLRWYEGKRLVASVRGSDYAHAGEEEAIIRCFARFLKDSHRTILDAGCGQGGTAHFIQQQGWGKVTGFDVEEASIQYAKNHYPDIEFMTADVLDVKEKFPKQQFDLICLFNSFYAFPDQLAALKSLKTLAKADTHLMIFDYTDLSPTDNNPMVIKGDPLRAFTPIRLDNIKQMALTAGWECQEIQELNDEYKKWYKSLLDNLHHQKENIIRDFTEQGYLKAVSRYEKLYDAFEKKSLGGCVFYAQALSR